MQDLIYLLETDKDNQVRVQNTGLDKRKAWLAWMPHTNKEIVVLSHKSQKIKLSGTVTTK